MQFTTTTSGEPGGALAAAAGSSGTIQEGDLVIVYESFSSIKYVYVTQKGCFSNKFGNFLHKVRPGGQRWRQGEGRHTTCTTWGDSRSCYGRHDDN
jgi:hypothetical protein